MKKVLQLCIILFNTYIVFGQEKSIIISTPLTYTDSRIINGTIQARDFVKLNGTFSYKATINTPLTIKANENLICTVDPQPEINPDTREINTSLEVGSLSGNLDVTPSGALNYSIPIEIPMGTNGMQPNISLVYNSQGGNGILGYSWNLSGLSAITRTSTNFYNDGTADGVDLQLDDKFTLDGNRLVATLGNYGVNNTQYHTEIETFAKITSYGTSGNGPSWFKVETKDGKILEYGNTTNSRIEAQGKTTVLLWRLNKIKDNNGNYINYYYKEENGESWIEKIEYTGNTSLTPYNTIKFLYEGRNDKNTLYIEGSALPQSVLLRSIKTISKGNFIKEFKLQYTDDFYTHLTEIIEYGKDGNQLNSTIINWGDLKAQFITSTFNFNDQNKRFFYGDFNGDGKTDLVLITKPNGTSDWEKWMLYISNTDGISFTKKGEGTLGSNFKDFFIADGDNDGDLDLFWRVREKITFDCEPCYSVPCEEDQDPNTKLSSDSSISKMTQDPITGECIVCSTCYYWQESFRFYTYNGTSLVRGNSGFDRNFSNADEDIDFKPADFNGDGKMDYLILNSDKNLLQINGLSLSNPPDFSNPDKIELIDFNGDGKTDIMTLDVEACKIYEYNNSTHQLDIIFSNNFSSEWSRLFFGDFNGDGKDDILRYLIDINWSLHFSTGNGLICSSTIPPLKNVDPDASESDNNFFVKDFNGDGKDDILEVYSNWVNGSATTSSFNVYYSQGNGNFIKEINTFYKPGVYKSYFQFGDFNGDGKQDISYYGNYANPNDLIYFHKDEKRHLVHTITNGFNIKTMFAYEPLSKGSTFYLKSSGATFPLADFQGALYAVYTITTPNGIGGNSITTYSYEGAQIHRQGKGFLGFKKITASNSVLGIKTITSNEFENIYFTVKKQTSESKTISNTLISRSITDFLINAYPNSQKRIFIYPVKVTSLDNLTNTTNTKEFLSYDGDGNVLSLKENLGTDATVEVQNSYLKVDAWCKSKLSSSKVKSTYGSETPDIKTSTFTYYTNGNLNTSLASGITNTYSYNGFGNVLSQTTTATGIIPKTVSSTYDPTGRFTKTSTNVLSQTSTFDYNDYGQLISETGIDGLSTQYAYDNWGKLKTVTYPNGKKSNYETKWLTDGTIGFYTKDQSEGAPDIISKFDQFGRKVRTESEDFKGKKYVDIVYNAKGQVSKSISPYYVSEGYTAAHVTDYVYDQYGRATSITSNGLTKTSVYSGKIITETFPSGETKVSTMDAVGKLKGVNNNGAYIAYNYYSDGQIKNTTAPGSTIGLTYDTNGFKDILNDPDAGSYNFNYNAIGQLTSKTSPIGTYSATYDIAGRVNTKNENTNNFTYTYVSLGNGLNQVKTISDAQGVFRDYNYDSYGRVTDFTQKVGDKTMAASYQYDIYGRTTAINYPGGFGIKYVYRTVTGELIEIRTNTDQIVWKLIDVNSQGQLSKIQYGNNLETILTYDAKNYIQNISTGTVQNVSYVFDATKGRFSSRTGLIKDISETFGYHTHNQLMSVVSTQKPELNLSMTFSDGTIGNIESKSDVGSFLYTQEGNAGPHAITDITNIVSGAITEPLHKIDYTSFNKVSKIEQGQYRVEFTYGADKQRSTMMVYQNEVLKRKVYYFGNYERHEEGSNVIELYYISSASGLTAIYKKQNGADTMFYVHTDHLGSINVITDQDQQVKARYFYSVWGERKNLDKTVGNTFQVNNDLPWLHRGFTGHEYITEIGLINMNGRVYDPQLAMFISPDPYVQAPDNPVNFNRYVYALNNPLLFTDPTGQKWKWWHGLVADILTGGLISTTAVSATLQSLSPSDPFGDALYAHFNGFTDAIYSGESFSNALNEGDRRATNSWKISKGLFMADDEAGGNWNELWQVVSRNTWQQPLTSLGYEYAQFSNHFGKVDVEYFNGATVIIDPMFEGDDALSLGGYIHLSQEYSNIDYNNTKLMHEYGHFLQTRQWGPLSLSSSVVSLYNTTINPSEHRSLWVEQDANARTIDYFDGRWSKDQKQAFLDIHTNHQYYDDRFFRWWYILLPSPFLINNYNTLTNPR